MFFRYHGKKYSVELNILESFHILKCIKFLKDNNVSQLCQNYVDQFFLTKIAKKENTINDYKKESTKRNHVDNSVIVNRDEINFKGDVYNNIKSIYEQTKTYQSNNVFDILIYKYENFFILTNSVNIKYSNLYKTNIELFEKNISESKNNDDLWKKIDRTVPSHSYSYKRTYEFIKNITNIIDEKSLLDVPVIKKIIEELEENKNILFLYIIDNNNNISTTFKTTKKIGNYNFTTIVNFNMNSNSYIKNSLNCIFTGSIHFGYYKSTISRLSETIYYTLKTKVDFQNNITYPNLIRTFNGFFMSPSMLDDNIKDIDFVLIKKDYFKENYDFEFYNLEKKEDYYPFKIVFKYNNLTKKAKLRYLSYNDFDKRNPLLISNKRGPGYIVIESPFSSYYSSCYIIHEKNKQNKIVKKYFKNFESLPLFRKNDSELIKIIFKTKNLEKKDLLIDFSK